MEGQDSLKPDSKPQEPLKAPSAPLSIKKFALPSPLLIILVVLGFGFAILIFSFFTRRVVKTSPPVPQAEVKDASKIAESPSPQPITAQNPVVPAGTQQDSSLAEKPTPFLSLSGILYDSQGSVALINGRVVPEGGLIEGARLDKVFSDRVELTFEGKKIILKNR